jgi:hypothetical protein
LFCFYHNAILLEQGVEEVLIMAVRSLHKGNGRKTVGINSGKSGKGMLSARAGSRGKTKIKP